MISLVHESYRKCQLTLAVYVLYRSNLLLVLLLLVVIVSKPLKISNGPEDKINPIEWTLGSHIVCRTMCSKMSNSDKK